MEKMRNTTDKFFRVGKYLNEIVEVTDSSGKVLHKMIKPVMLEFYWRDVMQVIIGATILAIPIAFTEEVWKLGNELPWPNILALVAISFTFVSLFVYYNYYKESFSGNQLNFLKRILSTYLIALIVVAIILTVIQKADWVNMLDVSLKRAFILAFPASLSAAVTDSIK
jgi:uncharacterized membrane protein